MGNALLVGIGGFLGSVARYLVSGYVQQVTNSVGFPYGTLVVNLTGCLVIGFLSQLADARGAFTPESRALIFAGFLGGYTTFLHLWQRNHEPPAHRRIPSRPGQCGGASWHLDKATGLPVTTYTADRGYDDGGLREELKKRGQHGGSTMPSSCVDSARPRKMPPKRDG